MDIPPQLIRVKRKATEDAPVSFLRVQGSKRHRSEHFVYQRQDQDAPFADIPEAPRRPVIHPSRPVIHPSRPSSRASAAFQSSRQQNNVDIKGGNGLAEVPSPASANTVGTSATASVHEPRRFHMSRKDMMLATSTYPSSLNYGVSKKRTAAPALFVERKLRRLPSKRFETTATDSTSDVPVQTISSQFQMAADSAPSNEQMEVDNTETRKYKKPGIRRLARMQKNNSSMIKAKIPDSLLNPRGVTPDKMAEDMDRFIMENVSLTLQQQEEDKKRQEAAKSKPRFKPKPIKRRHERHPEEFQQEPPKQEAEDADVGMADSDSDGDYVIETYIRVPANVAENVAPHHVGLLVFDNDPDIDLFYGDGFDSDDEYAEDDEDENAENYYTADYPDEEVASDDEYGCNPYSYRNGNASDLEEYDLQLDDDDYDDVGGLDGGRWVHNVFDDDDNDDDGGNVETDRKSVV